MGDAKLREESEEPEQEEHETTVVTLDVGGVIFKTYRKTLAKMPMIDTMLKRWTILQPSEPLFIDCDPQNFRNLLQFARGRSCKSLSYMPAAELTSLFEDADYLQMDLTQEQRFSFKLVTSEPRAKITNGGTVFTVGASGGPTTVLGDSAIPPMGRSYWEVKVEVRSGSDRCDCVGIAEEGVSCRGALLGENMHGWGIKADGANSQKLMHNGAGDASSSYPMLKQGDTIGVDVDMDVGSLAFWLNGKFVGIAFAGLKGKTLFPALTVHGSTVLRIVTQRAPPDLLSSEGGACTALHL